MAIKSDARLGGSIPQHNRVPEGLGIKPLFHSVRDIALLLDKTVKSGYGVLKTGTIMSVCSITGNLYPYPEAKAGDNNTNAKAYLVQEPSDADNDLYVTIKDSYKFQVGDELILDGSGAGTIEVQEIAITDIDITVADVWTLAFGDTSIAITQGATETVVGLSTQLKAHGDYGDLPFVITETANTKLILTWKLAADITDLATLTEETDGETEATEATPGVDIDQTGVTAENLGVITAIDRTAVNDTQAKISFTTGVTTSANFTAYYNGNVYVKSADEGSTPFAGAKFVLDADIDTGEGEFAAGALTSVVLSNAILYTASLIGYDSAAKTDMGTVDDGRFTILK